MLLFSQNGLSRGFENLKRVLNHKNLPPPFGLRAIKFTTGMHDKMHDVMHDVMHDEMHDVMHDVMHDEMHDVMHDKMHDVMHDVMYDVVHRYLPT